MKKTALFILTVFPFILVAQSDLKTGFIVKTTGDTVKGYLKQISEKQLDNKVAFNSNISSDPAIFTTKEIECFGYEGGNTYAKVSYIHPIDLTKHERFAKILVNGYYTLFSFWQKDISYFVVKDKNDSTYLLFDDHFSKASGILDEKGNYKNQLLYLSFNCRGLSASIDYLEYSQTSLTKYVNDINKCLAPGTKSSIAYKKDKTNLNVYAYAGGMAVSKGHEFSGRVMVRLTIPTLDKNVSFNGGVNYISYQKTSFVDVYYPGNKKEQTEDRSIVSVPLSIQYSISSKWIRPYLDAGVCFDYIKTDNNLNYANQKQHNTKFGGSFLVAIGIEGYVTKKLMIKADWRYELFLHYPTIGVGYFFK